MKKLLLMLTVTALMTSCSENYSNGERIGFVTKFSQSGIFWKSWEGELNLTQTGMNTSSLFPFSIDNDNPLPSEKISLIDSAANYGWKMKLVYREVAGWNWFNNRGNSDHFVKDIIVLDKTPMKSVFGNKNTEENVLGRTIDTIYVVIVPKP